MALFCEGCLRSSKLDKLNSQLNHNIVERGRAVDY